MDIKYLKLLSKDFPTRELAATEIINLRAIRSLPKGTEYFFSDLHGEYEAFLHLLKSASGMIRAKIDIIFGKSISASEREDFAKLIYYPERYIKRLKEEQGITDDWRRITIYRLVLVCELVAAKYTRSRVRKRMPQEFAYVLDELLNVTDDINKDFYYDAIISSVIETGISETFIIALCNLIQTLAIDKLHIIGDIFDRGPRPDIIMNELMTFADVDIQWGNHDISWMGAAAGNRALMANVIRISLSYNCFDVLEDGYGLNLRALSVFAQKIYKEDGCERFYPHLYDENKYDSVNAKLTAKMHKAITIIQMKLEGQLMLAHPEYKMEARNMLLKVNFQDYTVDINGEKYELNDTYFPTINRENPLALTEEEEDLMKIIGASFRHSKVLHNHIKFLYNHGSMYKICNGNLLYHGCIPMTLEGEFMECTASGKKLKGKALLDHINSIVYRGYFKDKDIELENEYTDFMWYLWCGAESPIYGKDKMAFFERYFIKDSKTHVETFSPYYQLNEREDISKKILYEFGLDSEQGHIINGHVPVKIKDGESPIKGNGKLFIIDGGISKAYQSKTGIAGYTLIFDSHGLQLASHMPFVQDTGEYTPSISIVEKMDKRINIEDTDDGKELARQMEDIMELIKAYRLGFVKEKGDVSAFDNYDMDYKFNN